MASTHAKRSTKAQQEDTTGIYHAVSSIVLMSRAPVNKHKVKHQVS